METSTIKETFRLVTGKTSVTCQVPHGYKRVFWDTLQKGDTVYLAAGVTATPGSVFGPFEVVDVKRRTLLNTRLKKTFFEYPEGLLVKTSCENSFNIAEEHS